MSNSLEDSFHCTLNVTPVLVGLSWFLGKENRFSSLIWRELPKSRHKRHLLAEFIITILEHEEVISVFLYLLLLYHQSYYRL